MAINEVHVGDIGTVFEVTLKDGDVIVDLSSVVGAGTTKEIIFKAPDKTVKTFSAAFKTDGTDGIIQYTTEAATDLHKQGTWKIQAHVVFSPTAEWKSDIAEFEVYKNLS